MATTHEEPDMTTTARPGTAGGPTLAQALWADAAATAATGAAMSAGSGLLDGPLGIPAGWLVGLGVFLLVYAADVAVVAARLPRSAGLARLVAAGNVVWVAASVLAVAAGAFDLTGLGVAFVLAQAAAVAVLTSMQVRALRAG